MRFLLVSCSSALPVAAAGLQCWSWLTLVVGTTWGRCCWGSFAPSSTQCRSACSSPASFVSGRANFVIALFQILELILFSASPPGVWLISADSFQSPPAVHPPSPRQCPGAGVWRWWHSGMGARCHRCYEAKGETSLRSRKKSDLSFTHYFFALTLFYFLLSGPGPVHPQGDHPASGDRKWPL